MKILLNGDLSSLVVQSDIREQVVRNDLVNKLEIKVWRDMGELVMFSDDVDRFGSDLIFWDQLIISDHSSFNWYNFNGLIQIL